MDRIFIVFQSEFLRRVKTKSFIILTLLAPFIVIAFLGISGFAGAFAARGDSKTVAVIDHTDRIAPRLDGHEHDQVTFMVSDQSEDSLQAAVRRGDVDGYVVIPAEALDGAGQMTYYSSSGGGLTFGSRLQGVINRVIEEERLELADAPPAVVEILRANVPLRSLTLTEEGTSGDTSIASSAFGYVIGFIIYMAMFIYGSIVIQGVVEEKQSRVVEVIVSSVRPFDLLMGKVLGIGAVGLLQMTVWCLMLVGALTFGGIVAAGFINPADLDLPTDASQEMVLDAAGIALPTISPVVFIGFLIFFLLGYLFYASLFATVAAAVEQPQDAQTLMLPITVPIIVALIFIGFLIESPNSALSVALSLIPFFSPILMVVRLAVTSVPAWQVLLSLALLAGSFIAAIWFTARVYRIGILMYGKKAGFKDIVRWARQP